MDLWKMFLFSVLGIIGRVVKVPVVLVIRGCRWVRDKVSGWLSGPKKTELVDVGAQTMACNTGKKKKKKKGGK